MTRSGLFLHIDDAHVARALERPEVAETAFRYGWHDLDLQSRLLLLMLTAANRGASFPLRRVELPAAVLTLAHAVHGSTEPRARAQLKAAMARILGLHNAAKDALYTAQDHLQRADPTVGLRLLGSVYAGVRTSLVALDYRHTRSTMYIILDGQMRGALFEVAHPAASSSPH